MDDCQDIVLTYSVKEIFYTLQGEGARSGRPAAAGAVCAVVRGAQRRALESLDCRPKKAQPGCGGRKARGK